MSMTYDRRVERSREAILSAATTVFLRDGYEGASIDDIASEAGVVKRTVYNVFDSKEKLFRATISLSIEIAERFCAELADDTSRMRDASRDLPRIGRRLASAVLLGKVIALRRLLISETRRFPELAQEYHRRAPGAVLRALSTALRDLAQTGQLRLPDPDIAAEHFAFLVMGAGIDRGLFGVGAVSETSVRQRADAGVAAFLRAYAP